MLIKALIALFAAAMLPCAVAAQQEMTNAPKPSHYETAIFAGGCF